MNHLPINADDMETSGIQTETLLRATTAWNNVPYRAYATGVPEITVLKITIPAKGILRWHEHADADSGICAFRRNNG